MDVTLVEKNLLDQISFLNAKRRFHRRLSNIFRYGSVVTSFGTTTVLAIGFESAEPIALFMSFITCLFLILEHLGKHEELYMRYTREAIEKREAIEMYE